MSTLNTRTIVAPEGGSNEVDTAIAELLYGEIDKGIIRFQGFMGGQEELDRLVILADFLLSNSALTDCLSDGELEPLSGRLNALASDRGLSIRISDMVQA